MKKLLLFLVMIFFVGCTEETIINPRALIAPEISIAVTPDTIHLGDSVIVSWKSQNAIKCFFNSLTEVAPNGQLVFRPQTNTVYSVTAVSADGINVTALDSVRLEPWRFTLSVTISGMGLVIKEPDTINYIEGSSIKLTAVPEVGWVFNGWSGDFLGTANPVTINMNNNKNIVATFRQLQYYSIDLTTLGNGKVIKNPDQTTYVEGSQVILMSVPDSGYEFSTWSGDISGTMNPLTVLMNRNKTISATFIKIVPVTIQTIGYYPFNGDTKDASGNGYNGYATGATLTTDRLNAQNSALYFNGHSYVSIPHNDIFNMKGNRTVCAWFKISGVSPVDIVTIMSKRNGNSSFWLLSVEVSKINFALFNGFSSLDYHYSVQTIPIGTWVHVAIVIKNDTSYMYINGALDSVSPITVPRPLNTRPFMIGYSDATQEAFIGSIDDVRLYDGALTEQEITTIYNSY